MAFLTFTSALKRFFPSLKNHKIEAAELEKVFEELNQEYPGIKDYLLNDHSNIREHINVYINEVPLASKEISNQTIESDTRIHISQAISGG